MTITALGAMFLPFSLFVFLFRRAWLWPLLYVAAVLQSPALAVFLWNEERYGVTPFLWTSALVALDLVWRWRRDGRLVLGDGTQRKALVLWMAFGGVSLAGALLWPWAFDGVDVYSPLEKGGVTATRVPLTWSISHLAQVVNLGLILLSMLWVAQQRQNPWLARRMWIGVVIALVVSAAIGLQQRLGWDGLVPLWDGFWASNPTYDQNFRTWTGQVPRVSWPLVDASYGSVWYAAVFGGFAAMFLTDVQRNRALLGALVALFALGNSLGEAGVLTVLVYLVVALLVVMVAMWQRADWRGGLVYRLALAALVFCCLGLAVHLVLRKYGLSADATSAVHGIWTRWTGYLFGGERIEADAHALSLLAQTWGLGVGMGSNRSSSYVTTLLGNTGVLGTLLFFVAFGYQLKALAGIWARSSGAVFFLGGSVACLIAVTLAIPDQNWPAFWIFLLGGLACIGSEPAQAGMPTQAAHTPLSTP